MKLYPGVYYFINELGELYIYKLDYDGTWYVLDASSGVWNSINEIPAFFIENLKKY